MTISTLAAPAPFSLEIPWDRARRKLASPNSSPKLPRASLEKEHVWREYLPLLRRLIPFPQHNRQASISCRPLGLYGYFLVGDLWEMAAAEDLPILDRPV